MTDMQPENSPVPNGPEQAPANVTPNGERIPVLPTPEGGLDTRGERVEQTAEASAAAADFAAVGVPLPPPLPVAPTTTQSTDDSPIVAGDEDVIEKEWVDKAKKIIQETKDDPYARTTRVNELQRDYLKKRYSKDLGASE
jgi:Txe/YoeB family toxin of Txe-Axe toxin-antitoxin module